MESQNTDNQSIAFITSNENHKMLRQLLKEGIEVLVHEKIPKNKDAWYFSPQTIIIDIDTQPNYEKEIRYIKEVEEYENVPIILIVPDNFPSQKRMNQVNEGIFAHLFENSVENSLFIIGSALFHFNQQKEMYLKVNELNRLLSTSYLVIDSKTILMEKIKERIDKIADNLEDTTKKELLTLSGNIQDNIKKEYHYQLFKVHFEEIHPQFFHNILSYNKNLTDNNLKLLAFLKMGFNNSEISFLLSISTAAVLKSIQRIKKKLSISAEDSLREFIFNIKG